MNQLPCNSLGDLITSIERVEVVSVTFFSFLRSAIDCENNQSAFMPRASLARVYNSPRILGVQLRLRSAGAAESRQCGVIDMGDILRITLQLAGCDKRYGNNC